MSCVRRRRRAASLAVSGVLGLTAGLVGARTIDALFSSNASARINLTIAATVVNPPQGRTCTTQGLPLVVQSARLNWTAPSGGNQTGYVVKIRWNGEVHELVTLGAGVTTYTISEASLLLLDLGIVGDLIQFLRGTSTPIPVSVNAKYGNVQSADNFTLFSIVHGIGLLGSINCAAGAASLAGRAAETTTSTSSTAPSSTTPSPTSAAPPTTTADTAPSTTATTTTAPTTTTTTSTSTTTTTVAPTTTVSTTLAPTTTSTTVA